jgi:hypothetical protein
MIIAIHQPNFLPWLGYFYKMARADTFVFLDNVAFADGGYTNRVKIKTAQGAQWLTVPVLKKGLSGQPIVELAASDRVDWRRKTLAALETNYRQCPYYKDYAPRLGEILSGAGNNLADLNIQLIEYLAAQLGITTPTVRSSQLKIEGDVGDHVNIALCKTLGADTYFSGLGAKAYQKDEDFRKAKVRLVYTGFQHPTYPQPFGAFEAGMSVMDLLFNAGPESSRRLGL